MIRKSALKRSTTPIPKKRKTLRRGPIRDAMYKDWIRTLPCCACFAEIYRLGVLGVEVALVEAFPFRSECAHTGSRGMSQKASDHDCVPLCGDHHRKLPGSYHASAKTFFERHNLPRLELICALRTVYRKAA